MHRRTDPRSPVQSQSDWSLLPIIAAMLAGLGYFGWQNRDAAIDWLDGEPLAGATGPASASIDLVTIFSTDDYPRRAVINEEQGTTGFRVEVSRRGRVTKCEIVQTSGSEALDRQTCRIVSRRARFSPARDQGGRRIEGSFSGRVRWELPPG